MFELIAIEPRGETRLQLSFPDGTWGMFDFVPLAESAIELIAPLPDRTFFPRYFIEAGALACPNGFEPRYESLYRRLQKADSRYHRDAAAV